MITSLRAITLAISLTAAYPIVHAQSATSSTAAEVQSAPEMTAEQFLASLNFQSGKITLPGGIATLNLPSNFKYLSPKDTEKVLVDAWGNPAGNESLGMIVPATGVLGKEGWGVIITYSEDGHVKDNDADDIKYDELLKDMQKKTLEQNDEREKAGYGAMKLVGWAESPSYNKQTHKFYWAKELEATGESEHTLNYNIRVLGRKGVLVLNAVAGMHQIKDVKSEMQNVVAFTEFTPTNTYADFDSSTDHVAEYGLAALVAGGVAAKLGLFGKLLALLLAFKKIIIVGAIALFAGVAKLFGRKS